ncbi:MAG: radical SAM protein [Candidatus Odinarchaeota archaeon]
MRERETLDPQEVHVRKGRGVTVLPVSTDKNNDLLLVPQHFGSTVYCRQSSRYYPFDRETTRLLTSLKSRSLPDILQTVTSVEERRSIAGFYREFYSRGFFTVDHRFAGDILDIEPPKNHLAAPMTVHLEISASCNLSCRHCFAGKFTRSGTDPLSLAELDTLFTSLSRTGSFRLGLTGGEPLMREDLLEIIDLAIARGLSPCLTTNGLLITEEIARELGKRNLVWLNVSVEGPDRESHEAIRGKDTFERLLDKLALLKRYARFSLAFTVTKRNYLRVQECVNLARATGASAAVFRPLYPIGTALDHPELLLGFQDYLEALNMLAKASSSPGSSNQVFKSDHPWGPETRMNSSSVLYTNFGCGAGNLTCSISVTGDVSPCSFLGPEYTAGNLKERSFDEIWNESTVFNKFRALEGNETCLSCRVFSSCHGGCRARALSLNNGINLPDPWCVAVERKRS